MVKNLLYFLLIFLSAQCVGQQNSQWFSISGGSAFYSFQCVTDGRTIRDSCDICPNSIVESRSFNGLLIFRDSVPWKWIDQPYSIRVKPGNLVEYWEHGPSPYNERVTIELSLTPFTTVDAMADSTFCNGTTPGSYPLWYASDSISTAPVFRSDTVKIVGRGIIGVDFDSTLQKFVITADTTGLGGGGGGGGGSQTLSNTSDATSHTVTLSGPSGSLKIAEGSGIEIATTGTTADGIATVTATDPSATNEIQRLDTFTIVSNILRASLINDGVPFSSVDLSPYVGTGTVTDFSAGDLSPLFTTSEATTTTTPALSFVLSNSAANTWFGNNTAGAAAPSFNSAAALTDVDDTNITLTLGGTPATALLNATSITAGWSGTLAVSRGGIGVGTITGVMQGNGTGAVTGITNSSTVGEVLRVTGTNSYGWGPLDLSDLDATTGDLSFLSLPQVAGLSLLGRSTNTTGDLAAITAVSADQVMRVSTGGTTIGWGQVATGGIADNAVGNAQFRQGAAKSVVGVTGNATANVADIATTVADQVLVNNAGNTAIGWGTVNTAGITNGAVTYAKIQNAVGNNVVLGNNNGAGTAYEELNAAALQALILTGTANRFALWTATNTLGDDAAFTFSAANDRMTVTGTLAGTGANNAWLNLNGGAITGATELLRGSANIAGAFTGIIANANNGASGTAYWEASVGGTSAGDPFFKTTVTGGTSIVWGQDNSAAGDPWRLTPLGTAPGSVANVGITVLNQASPLVGINKDLPIEELDVAGEVRAVHYLNTGNLWNNGLCAFGTGAGTGPTIQVLSGGNNYYIFEFTTGTTPTNNGVIATLTFPNAFPVGPTSTTFSPRIAQAATDIAKFYIQASSDTAVIIQANGTLAASTQYKFMLHTGGRE